MSNKESNTKLLVDIKAKFESKNNGEHLIIESRYGYIDFWPSSGKWAFRVDGEKGQGFEYMAASLRKRREPVEAKPDQVTELKGLLTQAWEIILNEGEAWPANFRERIEAALEYNKPSGLPWD